MKLYYFPAPGRAECSRIMLGASGTAFEDIRFKREEWVETYKAMSPTGQSPFLELDDGKVLAQSSAIDHYVASLTGFLPTDAWTLAKTDELLACLEDVSSTLMPTFGILDVEEKTAARKKLFEEDGAAYKKLKIVDALVAAKAGEFFAGDDLSLADVAVFTQISMLNSGMLDGIDAASTAPFTTLTELRAKVAAHPKIQPIYAEAEGTRLAFQPSK